MKFILDWLKENDKKGVKPSNINQLAKELKLDRPLLDRMLGKTKDTADNPQSRYDIRKMRELRKLMKLSVAEFYTKLENEFTE